MDRSAEEPAGNDAALNEARASVVEKPGVRGYLPQLDGLRALAVTLVIFFHTQPEWFPGGYIGVDIFFVLSGFLITGILVREYDRTGTILLGHFYARRALRLLPALLLLALVLSLAYLVLLDPAERAESIGAVLAAVAYITSPLAASGADLGSMLHAWSLSVEEYFYVGWPILLLLVMRWIPRSRVAWAVAAIVIVSVAYRLVVAILGWPLERIYYAIDTRAEQLLIGCLLALLVTDERLRPKPWIVAVSGAALALFVVLPQQVVGLGYRYGGSTVIAIAAGILIAGLVARPAGPFSRTLSLPPLIWVGKRSYGIYLWHAPVAAMIGFALPSWVPLLPADILFTFLIAALSFRFVEQPFLRLKVRFGPGRAKKRAT